MGKLRLLMVVVLLTSILVMAQEQPDPKVMIPPQILSAIANEVSGAAAFDLVLDMCGYEHMRRPDEFTGTFREAAYAEQKAKEFGFSDVKIERIPQPGNQWAGEMAELWVTEPVQKLVTRYRDLAATLAQGSKSADVKAEMVYAGRGDADSDYEHKDVKGKIVLVSGPVNTAHDLAVRKYGAEGVVSFFNGTGKGYDHPDQIPWSNIGSRGGQAVGQGQQPARTTFGFLISHRMGMDLLSLLENHKKVVVHAKVKATELPPGTLQIVQAIIPGDGSSNQEVQFVGHLFEGTAKQGANDNCSGPATQMEAGRAWIKLIAEGVLPRPRRTVRFLWLPEISGTRAFLQAHADIAKRVLAAVNFDMVGGDQTKNHNSFHMDMTPYSLPSFLNDVGIQMMEYVGDTNREKIHNRRIQYGFMNPIIDPKGSHDPFWYQVEKYYGSSDHVAYVDNEPRIPSVMFQNWPDAVYHTTDDSPYFMDPTQMKRTCFLAVTIGHILANSGPREAVAIAGLTMGYGQRRLGDDMTNALGMISRSTAADLNSNCKEALNVVKCAYIRERRAIRSSSAMMADDKAALDDLAQIESSFTAGEPADLNRIKAAYRVAARALKVAVQEEPVLTEAEKSAAKLYPERKPGIPTQPAGFGGPQEPNPPLAGFYANEARSWADGQHSVLDIRNLISAEFGPVTVENVLTFFRKLEQDGSYGIIQR